jgi:hypothetical protein
MTYFTLQSLYPRGKNPLIPIFKASEWVLEAKGVDKALFLPRK